MNNEYFQQMMARLQSGSMLPPPSADYAPGGAMFPVPGKTPVDPNAPPPAVPTSLLGKLGALVAPNTQAQMAGKGGGTP